MRDLGDCRSLKFGQRLTRASARLQEALSILTGSDVLDHLETERRQVPGQRCRIEAERVRLAHTANGRERVVASGKAHGPVEQAAMNVREDDLAAGRGVVYDVAEDRIEGLEGGDMREG